MILIIWLYKIKIYLMVYSMREKMLLETVGWGRKTAKASVRVGGRCMGPTWIGWQWMHLDPSGLKSEECKGACVWYCLGGNKGGEGIRRTKRDWFWRFWLTPQQKRLLVFQHQHRLCKTIDVNQFSW